MRKLAILYFSVLTMIGASPCFGWGPEGHRIIGDIATKYLSAKSKAAIKDLLGDQGLGDAGNWADEIRKDPAYDWVKPLHYINVPRGAAKVDLQRDCKNEQCVLGAITHYRDVLKSKRSTRQEKIIALKLLIHFVGDVHQPLHVSYEDDRGGNFVKARFFDQGERNLHSIWDEGMIKRRMHGDREAMEKDMVRKVTEKKLKEWREIANPIEWANESLTITRRLYKDVPPRGQIMDIGEEYYQANIETVEDRLTAAGVRLAAMLNGIFGEDRSTNRPANAASKPATSSQSAPME